MTEIARETGLGRESLYKALYPDGDPEVGTVRRGHGHAEGDTWRSSISSGS